MTRSFLLAAALVAVSSVAGAQAPSAPVSLRFAGMVGAERFACGRTYDNIGTAPSRFTPSEFRFYIHDVRLLTSDGRDVPVTLEADGRWQTDGVALVDFEDGTGPCSNGTPELHTEVRGRAAAQRYAGVRFTIGVPFAANHADPVTQPSPLNLSRMMWSWNSGHKFIRLDGRTGTGKNWVLHLGSTGCTPDATATTIPTTCAQRNAVVVSLTGFDPATDVIIADVAALYAASNLETNQEKTAAGCMSGPTDRDCAPIFAALGLPFPETPVTPQRFFRVAKASSLAAETRP